MFHVNKVQYIVQNVNQTISLLTVFVRLALVLQNAFNVLDKLDFVQSVKLIITPNHQTDNVVLVLSYSNV